VCVCVDVGPTRKLAYLFFVGLAECACEVGSQSGFMVTVPIYKASFSLQ
jgi:hypothetical protein